ncbi:MAG: FAD-linked oxidase C-terminal domain-containing protein, partial [Pseudoruegeria sp.]
YEDRIKALDPDSETLVVCHLGDGNIHHTMWPTRDDAQLMDDVRSLVEDIVADLRGSFSAEHGIGLSKLNSMTRRKAPVAVNMMRQIKLALDPNNIMNPGKVIPPAD